jgi:Protein of unknown function (DUF3489)
MTTYTIDEQNNITAFATKEEAAGTTPALVFSSQKELAKLGADWPIGRFIEIWNGFAGVAPFGELKPVKKFTDRKTAVARIWQAIQKLHAEAPPASMPEPEAKADPEADSAPTEAAEVPPAEAAPVPETMPVPETTPEVASASEPAAAPELPSVAPQVADVAPPAAAATLDASPAENAPAAEQPATKSPKRKQAAKPEQAAAAPRETSKTAQVVAMLQRPEGATITEIMTKMGWLKHTVRGFMAGAMKKAGYTVESFKPEGGERSYRINSK